MILILCYLVEAVKPVTQRRHSSGVAVTSHLASPSDNNDPPSPPPSPAIPTTKRRPTTIALRASSVGRYDIAVNNESVGRYSHSPIVHVPRRVRSKGDILMANTEREEERERTISVWRGRGRDRSDKEEDNDGRETSESSQAGTGGGSHTPGRARAISTFLSNLTRKARPVLARPESTSRRVSLFDSGEFRIHLSTFADLMAWQPHPTLNTIITIGQPRLAYPPHLLPSLLPWFHSLLLALSPTRPSPPHTFMAPPPLRTT